MGRSIGTWGWDLRTDLSFFDDVGAQLYSVPAIEAVEGASLARSLRTVHEDDRARVDGLLGRSISTGSSYAATYRVGRPEGGYRWLFARATPQRDGTGRIVRLPGVSVDLGETFAAREMAIGEADIVADLLVATRDAALPLRDPMLTGILDLALLQLATGPSSPELN